MANYLETSIQAARLAGKYLLENQDKISLQDVDVKAQNDFVTRIDRESEKIISQMIAEQFPGHRIRGEEGTNREADSQYQWWIDPLDGTKNYIQKLPFYSVSIALQKNNDIICGVVYDPVHDELFSAEKGAGAYCNERRISVSPQQDFSLALIATGFPHKLKQYLPVYLEIFGEIFRKASGARRCGSAALDLCHTAMGRYEGFWELGLNTWDIAAGCLILEEAGGEITDFEGAQDFLTSGNIVCGNSTAHPIMLEIIKKHSLKLQNPNS